MAIDHFGTSEPRLDKWFVNGECDWVAFAYIEGESIPKNPVVSSSQWEVSGNFTILKEVDGVTLTLGGVEYSNVYATLIRCDYAGTDGSTDNYIRHTLGLSSGEKYPRRIFVTVGD